MQSVSAVKNEPMGGFQSRKYMTNMYSISPEDRDLGLSIPILRYLGGQTYKITENTDSHIVVGVHGRNLSQYLCKRGFWSWNDLSCVDWNALRSAQKALSIKEWIWINKIISNSCPVAQMLKWGKYGIRVCVKVKLKQIIMF